MGEGETRGDTDFCERPSEDERGFLLLLTPETFDDSPEGPAEDDDADEDIDVTDGATEPVLEEPDPEDDVDVDDNDDVDAEDEDFLDLGLGPSVAGAVAAGSSGGGEQSG